MKSSIHILPVKSSSEKHNNRENNLDYVRSDLSYLNSSFYLQSISEAKQFSEKNCKEKTGRTMQAKSTPIREGVLLIAEHHTAEDLRKLGEKLEARFGIKTIQAYCHKDEGHYDKGTGEWKPNYHAHMVFDWTDHSTGKSLKLNRENMTEVQSIVAEELGLERGATSSKEHLNALQFKNQEEAKDLKKVFGLKNGLLKAEMALKQSEPLRKEVEGLKTAKNALEFENTLLRSNKVHLESQIEENRKQLEKSQNQSKQWKY